MPLCGWCSREYRTHRGLVRHLRMSHGLYTGQAVRAIDSKNSGLKVYLPKAICQQLNLKHGDILFIKHIDPSYLILYKGNNDKGWDDFDTQTVTPVTPTSVETREPESYYHDGKFWCPGCRKFVDDKELMASGLWFKHVKCGFRVRRRPRKKTASRFKNILREVVLDG